MNPFLGAAISALLVSLIACASGTDSTVDPEPVATRLTARMEGRVETFGECLRVVGANGNQAVTLVWDDEQLRVNRDGDQVQIVDLIMGVTVEWTLGQSVALGGGLVEAPTGLAEDSNSIFQNCPSPFWLVGDVDL